MNIHVINIQLNKNKIQSIQLLIMVIQHHDIYYLYLLIHFLYHILMMVVQTILMLTIIMLIIQNNNENIYDSIIYSHDLAKAHCGAFLNLYIQCNIYKMYITGFYIICLLDCLAHKITIYYEYFL